MSTKSVQLTCQQCTRRKIRCNKEIPCSSCAASDLQCTPVQRQRLPRGRSGKTATAKNDALLDRVSRLEAIITSLKGAAEPVTAADTVQHQNRDDLFAPEFWSNLIDAVDDIKDAVLNEDIGNEAVGRDGSLNLSSPSSTANGFLFDNIAGNSSVCTQTIITSDMEDTLFAIYEDRFDSLLKVVAWSEVRDHLRHRHHESLDIASSALKSCILFAASATLLAHEMVGRDELITNTRIAAEKSLSSANLLTTSSLGTLQAFVIYLAALRATRENAQQWTLIPLAVRIASAQGIPACFSVAGGQVDQIKLRLWYCIGMLDLMSSFDRGSRPLLHAQDFPVTPFDIDGIDRALGATTTGTSFTSMTTSLLTYQAMLCQRKLVEDTAQAEHSKRSQQEWWSSQQAILSNFEHYAANVGTICVDASGSSTPLQMFTMAIARESLLSMQLLLHRPLQKVSTRLQPPRSDFDVKTAATDVLNSTSFKASPEFAKWSWYAWVKWYALAIVLAELCAAKRPWDDATRQSWHLANLCFERYAQLVVGTESGLLWRPVAKLMKKTTEVWRSQSPPQGTTSMSQQEVLGEDSTTSMFDSSLPVPTDALPTHVTNNWLHWDDFVYDVINQDFLIDDADDWLMHSIEADHAV